MKRLIIVTVLLLTIISVSIVSIFYTTNLKQQLQATTQSIKLNLLQDNFLNAHTTINELEQKWLKHSSILSLFVRHDELEKVSSSVVTAKSAIASFDKNLSIAEINNIDFMLTHILSKEIPTIDNVL